MKRVGLQKQKKTVDRNFFILILVFVVLGLIAVADASAPQALNVFNDKLYFLKQQALWAGVGVFDKFRRQKNGSI